MNVVPEFLKEALTPVAKECGERLADIVNLAFTPIIRTRVVRDKKLELFLLELEKEIKKIPEENVIEPPLNIVGPALEDVGKYYHEQEYLRKCFARLVASSMNKECYVHPSFIEVIEQLTSDEAKILSKLPEKGRHEPLVDICVEKQGIEGKFTVYRNCGVLGFEAECSFPENISLYTDNLKRLALVEIPENGCLADEWRYDKIVNFRLFCAVDGKGTRRGGTIL